jgi:two-component system phosphate regulon sensor histidine kinase PhoR
MNIARDQRRSRRFTIWLVVTALPTLLLLFGATAAAIAWVEAPALASLASLGVVLAALVIAVVIKLDVELMEPLERLARAARRLTAGNLDETIQVQGLPEVNDLGAALNEMAAQLREEVETLTAERNQARLVFTTMTDGMLIIDQQMRVQRANEAAGRLLHFEVERAAGQSLAAVVRDHELRQVLAMAMAAGESHTAIVRLGPPPAGRVGAAREEPRYVQATGIPLLGQDHAADAAGLLMLNDVTELRRSEAIRREFVANVSHELRTPLASLKALVETLEVGALDDPPAALEFLGQMHVEVDSLAQLVQELLELSKIESGGATFRFEAAPAQGLLAVAEERLRMQAERAGVAVEVVAPADVPEVWADPARIVQVLINLLHNAVKFTPAGGEITLRASPHGDGVRFSVEDTGVGIEPEDLPRIFERFYKVDKSRASGGTGLGLAVAKHIIQAHGGRIWAASEGVGQGATFSFTLPAASLVDRRPLPGEEREDGLPDLRSSLDRAPTLGFQTPPPASGLRAGPGEAADLRGAKAVKLTLARD